MSYWLLRPGGIADAGGWEADTLTEDIDLSYRAQLAGWRLDYCFDLACPAELPGTVDALKTEAEDIGLLTATITTVRVLGMGDRVCVDTCSNMRVGEGMLVGNSSAGMFLVHAECVDNPYVEQRPFRVNAGPVHAYIRVPGERTRYLSEIRSGDEAKLKWIGAEIRF